VAVQSTKLVARVGPRQGRHASLSRAGGNPWGLPSRFPLPSCCCWASLGQHNPLRSQESVRPGKRRSIAPQIKISSIRTAAIRAITVHKLLMKHDCARGTQAHATFNQVKQTHNEHEVSYPSSCSGSAAAAAAAAVARLLLLLLTVPLLLLGYYQAHPRGGLLVPRPTTHARITHTRSRTCTTGNACLQQMSADPKQSGSHHIVGPIWGRWPASPLLMARRRSQRQRNGL
jgi:hypothetical protein